MADNTVYRDSDGKIYTNILDFMCQKCELSQEEAVSKYDGWSDKKKAKMHNLHQQDMIELLQEKEEEEMSEEAYVKNSEFYFTKFEGKPNMEMVEGGKSKAKKRYEKLKVHEKWFIHQALEVLPEEVKQLKSDNQTLLTENQRLKVELETLRNHCHQQQENTAQQTFSTNDDLQPTQYDSQHENYTANVL